MGAASIALGTVLALLRYQGPFTLLNLTISELGLLPDSPWAAVFNGGLIVGGLALGMFLVGIGWLLRGWSGALVALLGGLTGLMTALVGVFPVDHRYPVLMSFAHSWLAQYHSTRRVTPCSNESCGRQSSNRWALSISAQVACTSAGCRSV